MIEKCPECDVKVSVLLDQPSESQTTGTFTMSTTTFSDVSYSPTSEQYKCPNPRCWVTKIKESWE